MQLYRKCLKQSQAEDSDNFYKQLRFYSLQQMVEYVIQKKLNGDFVECGVWKGHSACIIAQTLLDSKFNGKFYIFDVFDGGLSNKVDKDKNLRFDISENKIKEESSVFSSSIEQVKSCLKSYNFIHLFEGWIPSQFYKVKGDSFSFVHIDVDLYEATLSSLTFFFDKLVVGGVIVCDDYGGSQFPGAKKAIDEFLSCNSYKIFYEVPMGGCFIIK